MIMTGRPKSQRDKITVIMDIISNLDKKIMAKVHL